VTKADVALQAALLRLQLWLVGKIQALLVDITQDITASVLRHADSDGKLDAVGYLRVQRDAQEAWKRFAPEYEELFRYGQWEATSLPFGMLAIQHQYASGEWDKSLQEARRAMDLDPVFRPQVQSVVDAAWQRIYSDGIPLSQRIWKLDQESWQGIQRILAQGVSGAMSAWDIAQLLEQYLGAGADCPRWTEERLRNLTKQDIASGDRTGLLRGPDCDGRGVAYNALRLARNELQWAHHSATDDLYGRMPWVLEEKVNLSPSHPDIGCACEEVVVGGEKGEGVYPKGKVTLPIHVQCLCYKTPILMPEDQFILRLRGWTRGTWPWTPMDEYAAWLRLPPTQVFTISIAGQIANSLATWLWGSRE
jgi:hypothetical protein